jgi:hypothetical protein
MDRRHVVITAAGVDEVRVERGSSHPAQGWFCPEFGRAIAHSVIVLRRRRNDGRELTYQIDWRS